MTTAGRMDEQGRQESDLWDDTPEINGAEPREAELKRLQRAIDEQRPACWS